MTQPKFAVRDLVRIRRKHYLNRAGQTGTVVEVLRGSRDKSIWDFRRGAYRVTPISVIRYQVAMADGKRISQQASNLDPSDGKWPGFCQACGAPLFPVDRWDCPVCHSSDDDES